MTLDEELKIPHISDDLIVYLEKVFHPFVSLERPAANNDEAMGYLKGQKEIIAHLKALQTREDD